MDCLYAATFVVLLLLEISRRFPPGGMGAVLV